MNERAENITAAQPRTAAAAVDVAIIGGGPVGLTLAVALADSGLSLALIDAARPAQDDNRPLALAASSERIFKTLGLWPAVASAACPLGALHVSDRGHFGSAHFTAREVGLSALGQVVPAQRLLDALQARANHLSTLARYTGRVGRVQAAAQRIDIEFTSPSGPMQLGARLAVAADGTHSAVREQLRIAVHRQENRQTAISTTLHCERPHENTAYERFTAQGPLALLPLAEQRMGVVWTRPSATVGDWLALSDREFLHALQDEFGGRLGRFSALGARSAWPLTQLHADATVHERLVLIGNAALTVHPVAGQGLNLALRDVAVLAEELTAASVRGTDPGDPRLLHAFAQQRRADHRRVLQFTDLAARAFAHRLRPVIAARGLALAALQYLPPARQAFLRIAAGLEPPLPRLVQGLPLRDAAD